MVTSFCFTFALKIGMSIHEELSIVIRNYNAKGWSPATSTNYSFKDEYNQICVSRSGVDKSQFTSNDFIKGHYIRIIVIIHFIFISLVNRFDFQFIII